MKNETVSSTQDAVSIPGLNIPAYLGLIQNPYDTQVVFNLIRTLSNSENLKDLSLSFGAATAVDPGLQELYRSRYAPLYPTNQDLLKLPKGSLGQTLAEHLISNKIELDFQGIDKSNIFERQANISDYARLRALRLHDILHVLIGADTSPIGESMVAAFQAAQYSNTFQSVTVSFLLLHVAFFENKKLHGCIKSVSQAFETGLRATPAYGVPWEDFLGESLASLRERFNISQV